MSGFREALGRMREGAAASMAPAMYQRRLAEQQQQQALAQTGVFAEVLAPHAQAGNPFAQAFVNAHGANPGAAHAMLNDQTVSAAIQRATAADQTKPLERVVAVSSDDPVNAQFGLGIQEGQRARVRVQYGQDGGVVNASLASVREPAAGADAGPFGGGIEGRALGLIHELSPLVASGQADPMQMQLYEMALQVAQRPRTVMDPISQTFTQMPGLDLSTVSGVPGARGGGVPAPAGNGPARRAQVEPIDFTADGDPQVAALNAAMTSLPSGRTIFHQADNLTGPDGFIRRWAPRVPGLGGLTNEAVGAEEFAKQVTELLVESMRREREGSIRAVQEINDLRARFGVTPEIMNTPERLRETLAQRDVILRERLQEIEAELRGERGDITGDERKRLLNTRNKLAAVRRALSPPALQSADEFEAFREAHPPGTEFVIRDPRTGRWRPAVTE